MLNRNTEFQEGAHPHGKRWTASMERIPKAIMTAKTIIGIQLGIGLKLFLGGIGLLAALPALGWDSVAVGCAAIGLAEFIASLVSGISRTTT
mgnify:CR=1 FL=1